MPDGPEPVVAPSSVREELERELRRVTDRLRTLSPVRLAEPRPGTPSRAALARSLAQALADATAVLEAGERPPVRRVVPMIADSAVGDQVAVTGADLLLAAGGPAPGVPAERVAAALAGALTELRAARRAL